MDVWAWVYGAVDQLVEEGHDRLASLVQELPEVALEGDLVRTEAMYADALALASGVDLPWLPVFLRHWRLQARAAVHGEGATVLTDAVAALDAAHVPEAAGCPQSVCTVQDLSICYGRTDGPGWAPERMAVVREALAGIDPTWPCWRCLHDEWAQALLDLGRAHEALEVVEAGRDAAGESIETLLRVLLVTGRHDEALRRGQEFLARHGRTSARPRLVAVGTLLALARAALGDAEGALAGLPDPEGTQLEDHVWWVRAAEALVAAGAMPNDSELGARVWDMVERQRAAGCWFDTVVCVLAYVRLALGRERTWVARRGVEVLREVLPSLRDPRPVAAEVEALAAAVAAAPPAAVDLPGDPDALVERMTGPEAADDADPEEALDVWSAARDRWPDHPGVAEWYARALLASGHRDGAVAVLDEFVRRVPGEHGAAALLIEVLLDRPVPDAAAVTALAEMLRDAGPKSAEWALARLAYRVEDWAGCVEHCRRIVAMDPSVRNTRRLLADAATRTGDHDVAVGALDELRDLGAWTPDDEWALVMTATLGGRWDRVREAAERLGFVVEPGEGPIDEEWHLLVVRYDDGDEVLAVRTGPVTARVLGLPLGGTPMRYGDELVFTPAPLDPPEPDDDEDRLLTFPHRATLREAGHRGFELEGRDPGGTWVEELSDALREAGCAVRFFEMTDPPEDPAERTVYATVAVPPDRDLAAVHDLLLARTAAWGVPVAWAALAAAAGDAETAGRHEALREGIWGD